MDRERENLDEEALPKPVIAVGTPVRYRPKQPELFSIRFIGQEGKVVRTMAPHHRHCLIEFPCGAVLLVLTSDVEPLP